jgi:hypothetical protein
VTFFTICTNSYLLKARLMASSVRIFHPESKVILLLCERSFEADRSLYADFDYVLLPSDLPIVDVEAFMLRHDITEACTAIKAVGFLELMGRETEEEYFVYLDPDVWVFSRFEELEAALLTNCIVLTPHHLNVEFAFREVVYSVFATMMCGIYNLGFIALRRSPIAASFLNYWNAFLQRFCYIEFHRGLFVDQRWIDLAASIYPVYSLREPGYNVANWNVFDRKLIWSDGSYLAGGKPLRFFHFSGVDSGKDLKRLDRINDLADVAVRGLREEYRVRTDSGAGSKVSWTFDRFISGSLIGRHHRLYFRREWEKCQMRSEGNLTLTPKILELLTDEEIQFHVQGN